MAISWYIGAHRRQMWGFLGVVANIRVSVGLLRRRRWHRRHRQASVSAETAIGAAIVTSSLVGRESRSVSGQFGCLAVWTRTDFCVVGSVERRRCGICVCRLWFTGATATYIDRIVLRFDIRQLNTLIDAGRIRRRRPRYSQLNYFCTKTRNVRSFVR